jgi:plastocyanin
MNRLPKLVAVALAVALAFSVCVGSGAAPADEAGLVTGSAKLVDAGTNKPVKDASKVVVWLESRDETRTEPAVPHKFRMLQHDKMFEPSFLVVPVGSLVDFPNLDPWFHNVFSLYQGKRFDLGLYEAGAHKEIRFDRQGASYIFCNIHPEMAAVIMTVDSDFYAVSDGAGHLSIANVPRGNYTLRVWYENATAQALSAAERRVEIENDTATLPAISLAVTQHVAGKHKNKYGLDYDSKPGVSDYEN